MEHDMGRIGWKPDTRHPASVEQESARPQTKKNKKWGSHQGIRNQAQ